MTDQADTLRERVQVRMEVLGLNPFSAAKRANLKPGYIHDILRGKVKNPGADKLKSLALALETSIVHLLGGDDGGVAVWGDDGKLTQRAMQPALPSLHSDVSATLLPIRFELASDIWRAATEVSGPALGYEAAAIPPAYKGQETWFELVRETWPNDTIKVGSLVQVVRWNATQLLRDGDWVVVTDRVFVGKPQLHLVQRSLRRIESATLEGELRWRLYPSDEDTAYRVEDLDQYDEAGAGRRLSEIYEGMRSRGRLPDDWAETQADDARHLMETLNSSGPKIMGKVIRVLTPLQPDADFGIAV